MELKYKGLVKLSEECGELVQISQKLIQFFDTPHPNKKDLITPLQEEVADTLATLEYVISNLGLDRGFINSRLEQKLSKFNSYVGK